MPQPPEVSAVVSAFEGLSDKHKKLVLEDILQNIFADHWKLVSCNAKDILRGGFQNNFKTLFDDPLSKAIINIAKSASKSDDVLKERNLHVRDVRIYQFFMNFV